MNRESRPVVTLDDVLITAELARRPARSPDFEAENRALVALATAMAASPENMFQMLADTALALCGAGSAGVSVWESQGTENVFRWRGIAGQYAPYIGETMPRWFSPCGTVLDRNSPLLMAHPERHFTYIGDLCSPLREVLLVPFYQGSKPVGVGTVWVVAHTEDQHFDAEDVRLITSLTRFAGAAVQVLSRADEAEAAERSLRENEERFRALVTATSDVVYRMSPDWAELRLIMARDFIDSSSSAVRTWLENHVPPDERPRVFRAIEEAIRRKGAFELEHRIIRADGTVGWTFSRAVPVLDEAGNITEWFGAASDVTERKRVESESIALAEKLGLALAAGNLGTWEWDRATDGMTLSPRAGEIYGVAPDVPHNREQLRNLLHPDDQDRARRLAARAVLERTDYEIEYRVTRPDGAMSWVAARGRGQYDADGDLLRMHGVVQDITERRVAEEGLWRQSERIRLLWEAAAVLLTTEEPDLMMRGLFSRIAPHLGLDTYFNFMVDESGTFLRLESFVGIPEATAETIRRLEFGQAICGAVATSREPITATCIQSSDDPRTQLVKGFGIRAYACNPLLAGDRLIGTLSFASRTRDSFDPDEIEFLKTICHYATAAYDRLHLIRELRLADRKKDDFIALLAHELRNPLAPIRNGLEVIRLAGSNPATLAGAREMMDRQLAHMVRLIDDLLDVSRINRNKMQLRRARVTLNDVVQSAVETARPLLDAARHELTVSLPATPVILDADLTRLAQVFANLLTNSAKYTPPGGRVRLSAERADGSVVVSVEDTGIGIPADALPTIFDMFSQVDRTAERATGGLGIGLALVKGLVEMHGGEVFVVSEGEGKGARFTVALPAAAHVEPTAPVTPVAPIAVPSCRVLVVDDNRDVANSLASLLGILGNEVRTAHDGFEAIQAAEAFWPDMIFMDVGMPRMNGLDATRHIREQPWGRDITIVALTGWGQDNDREHSLTAGCNGHLVKPVHISDLQKALAESRSTQVR